MIRKCCYTFLLPIAIVHLAFGADSTGFKIQKILQRELLTRANQAMQGKPVTITAHPDGIKKMF